MNDFTKLIHDIETEARAEGPEAVAELAAFDARFALASALIARRKAVNLTQKELAGVTGVPQSEISRIERGQTNLSENEGSSRRIPLKWYAKPWKPW